VPARVPATSQVAYRLAARSRTRWRACHRKRPVMIQNECVVPRSGEPLCRRTGTRVGWLPSVSVGAGGAGNPLAVPRSPHDALSVCRTDVRSSRPDLSLSPSSAQRRGAARS